LLALLFVFLVVSSSRTSSQDQPATALDAIFSPLADAKSPGLAVLVRKEGRTVFERGYGVRELRSSAKIDPQTNFRLASSSKQFTAMSIMLLVHDGKLRYDGKLTDVFPDFPAYGKAITIRNLLNHTSGLPDYEDLMAAAENRKGAALWTPLARFKMPKFSISSNKKPPANSRPAQNGATAIPATLSSD